MKSILQALGAASVLALAGVTSTAVAVDAPKYYQIQSILNLGGSGTSWDHIDYDQSHHRLYLSRRADGLTAHCLVENVTEQLPSMTRLAPLARAGGVPWQGRSAWQHDVR